MTMIYKFNPDLGYHRFKFPTTRIKGDLRKGRILTILLSTFCEHTLKKGKFVKTLEFNKKKRTL